MAGRWLARACSPLFPIEELSIIGLAAVVKQLPKILRLIKANRYRRDGSLARYSRHHRQSRFHPSAVARRVRASDPTIPIVDYVSPSVWAWRPGRARAMLSYVDHVLALLPFEPEAYRRLRGPPCSYVGHPLTEQLAQLRPGAEEAREEYGWRCEGGGMWMNDAMSTWAGGAGVRWCPWPSPCSTPKSSDRGGSLAGVCRRAAARIVHSSVRPSTVGGAGAPRRVVLTTFPRKTRKDGAMVLDGGHGFRFSRIGASV